MTAPEIPDAVVSTISEKLWAKVSLDYHITSDVIRRTIELYLAASPTEARVRELERERDARITTLEMEVATQLNANVLAQARIAALEAERSQIRDLLVRWHSLPPEPHPAEGLVSEPDDVEASQAYWASVGRLTSDTIAALERSEGH